MKTIKPSKYQLFVKPDEKEVKTASGFILSESAVEKPATASVINVGSEVTDYKRDDTVVYKSYAGTDIKLNGDDYMLISEEDVLGVIQEVEG